MSSLNRTFLMGNLGAAPELLLSPTGKKYTRLNLATHRISKNDIGSWESNTDWHRVTVWGQQAENCVNYLNKGQAVLVEGYLSPYLKELENGKNLNMVSVTAQSVEFLTKATKKVQGDSQSES